MLPRTLAFVRSGIVRVEHTPVHSYSIDPGTQQSKKRVAFAKKYVAWSSQKWKSELQGCGDLKDFTYYPKDLKARFYRLRSPWTYMTDEERKKPEFQRPKKWFPKQEWKKTKKVKVLLAALPPPPCLL